MYAVMKDGPTVIIQQSYISQGIISREGGEWHHIPHSRSVNEIRPPLHVC
jgi:hypothetical protein